MKIYTVKSNWGEKQGMVLDRKSIGDNYIFIHFQTPVIGFFGEKEVQIHPGGCVIYECFKPQKFASPSCNLIHDWFHAQTEPFAHFLKKYSIECSKVYYPKDSGKISRLVSEIELETLRSERFCENCCDSLTEQIFIELARSETAGSTEQSVLKYKELFLKIRSEIQSDYCGQYTVEDMAKAANMSISRFFAVYKQLFGISPKKDLINLKLSRAKILLSGSNEPVERVAELSGYTNQYHFIRQFKKSTGMTPGKYRQTKT